jgi:glycerol uptake facilitator-like aquaporin
VVLDAKLNGALGLLVIAIAPAVAVAIGIYLFGKTSMAHFNPAVTVAFLITKDLERKKRLTNNLPFSRSNRWNIGKYFHLFYFWESSSFGC